MVKYSRKHVEFFHSIIIFNFSDKPVCGNRDCIYGKCWNLSVSGQEAEHCVFQARWTGASCDVFNAGTFIHLHTGRRTCT